MEDEDDSYNTVSTSLGSVTTDTYDSVNKILLNPSVIIILVVIIVIYFMVFASLGNSQPQTETPTVSNGSSRLMTIIIIAVFIILIVINGLQYFFGIDIIAKLKDVFSGNPELDITVDSSRVEASKSDVPKIILKKQVFNIPENRYIYADAKALCSAYDARLATYSEIEDAYKKGGEWCNYGWSDGQMALFPTQQKTWDELQQIEGHENDCGRPGINGGFIDNPTVRFGVNCYGYKPRITEDEEDLMANDPIYPKTAKDIAMENRVEYWKDNLSEVLVSPFNYNNWSKL